MEIADAIAKKMRRARGSNGERLFTVSEFLTAQQVASFSSGMAAKIKQQTTPEETLSDQDILAMEDEQNFFKGQMQRNWAIFLLSKNLFFMATLIITNSQNWFLCELWRSGDENPTISDGFTKTNQKWPRLEW